MKEFWEKLGAAIRHNKGQVIALILSAAMLVWIFGCVSEVQSIIEPDKKVTREALQVEVDTEINRLNAEIAKVEILAKQRSDKLDQLDAMKAEVARLGMVVLEGGTVNPIGIATTLISLIGIGAIADNQKKDGIIVGKG